MCLIFHATSNARVQQEGVEYGEEKRREEKGTGGGKGEWGKVSEQAALYAPRILKPIIWLNSFCNYPKGSALHTPNVVQTTASRRHRGKSGSGSGYGCGYGCRSRRSSSSGRGSNPFLQAGRKLSNLRTRQEVGQETKEGRRKVEGSGSAQPVYA